jgi:hypothetical protein
MPSSVNVQEYGNLIVPSIATRVRSILQRIVLERLRMRSNVGTGLLCTSDVLARTCKLSSVGMQTV